MEFISIGIIHTPYTSKEGMPIQPSGNLSHTGWIELFEEFVDGLKDLEAFSHIHLIYYFHLSKGFDLEVKPFLDETTHGVFATRAPRRPNPIGLSSVPIQKIEDNKIYFIGPDMINGTLLLDIKPYVPDFESFKNIKTGWLEKNSEKVKQFRSDSRFSKH